MPPLFEESIEFGWIKAALIRERNQRVVVGIGAVIFGSWLVTRLDFQQNEFFLGVLSLVALITGVWVLYRDFTAWKVEQMPLYQLLKYQQQNIVWAYAIVTVRLPFGVQFLRNGTVYFKLADGDELTIKIKEDRIKMLFQYLNYLLPHASFGFSPEKEQLFFANPLLLLQDDPSENE